MMSHFCMSSVYFLIKYILLMWGSVHFYVAFLSLGFRFFGHMGLALTMVIRFPPSLLILCSLLLSLHLVSLPPSPPLFSIECKGQHITWPISELISFVSQDGFWRWIESESLVLRCGARWRNNSYVNKEAFFSNVICYKVSYFRLYHWFTQSLLKGQCTFRFHK